MSHAHPSSPLSEAEMQRCKTQLLERARALVMQDADLRARLAEGESATSNTFVAGTEGGQATEADDEVIALLRREQGELKSVAEALERLEQGHYGLCVECGEAIAAQRLAVLPEAALCVGCQDMAEHRAAHGGEHR
ncbi:TraR/DksA family transcriptional regulator [Aquabacterium sp.]|uniref:TraR/DksA family transcriptional regulator n=1 Tax=Aquabacterium sp. TaxID=1872578 RepID=UPI0035C66F1F